MIRLYVTLFAASLLAGCGSTEKEDEYALVAAEHNATIAAAERQEKREMIMAFDARQRESLERELDLITQLGEREIEAKFAADLAAAAAPGTDSRPVVTVDAVAVLVAQQNADRAATRAAVAAKRKEIYAQLDTELKKWIDDPKGRQQERVAAALAVYARKRSEFRRFLSDTGAQLGVSIPGVTK